MHSDPARPARFACPSYPHVILSRSEGATCVGQFRCSLQKRLADTGHRSKETQTMLTDPSHPARAAGDVRRK